MSVQWPNLKPTEGKVADLAETEALVQAERGAIGGVDIADHLPEAGGGAGVDQRRHQLPADAPLHLVGADVDRMLDGVAVGRPLAERHGIGVADDDARMLRHDMGHLPPAHRFPPALEVLGVRGFEVAVDARVDAAPDVMQVDRQHRRNVGVA